MTLPLQPPKQRLWIWFVWLGGFYAVLVVARFWWQSMGGSGGTLADRTGHDNGQLRGGLDADGWWHGRLPHFGSAIWIACDAGARFQFCRAIDRHDQCRCFLILSRRQPLAWSMLKGAMLGALLGTPVGIIYIAPLIPELWIKLSFAVVWASFGVLHLYRIGEIAEHIGMTEFDERWDFRVGLVIGIASGATVAAVTGVGIKWSFSAALVLLCRADLKIAIPTSVVIMAFTSILGIAVKWCTTGVQPGVLENWLAAAPIVCLGAPLGAFVVTLIGRKPTLFFVAILCVGQFAWTCYTERSALGVIGFVLSVAAVGVLLLGFEKLRAWGIDLVDAAKQRQLTLKKNSHAEK